MIDKVVFIVPCLRSGGAERVMVVLANSLVAKGYKTEFLFTMDDITSYELNKKVGISINNSKRNPLGQIKFIRDYMKKNKNAVYISFFTYQNMYSLIARFFLPVKVVVSERNDPRKTLYGRRFLEQLRAFLYSKAYKVVFQTEEAKQCFSRKVQRKSVIICNPLSPELPEVFEGNRQKRIVAVARLNKQKNLPMLICGATSFLREKSEVCLEIYGEGDLRDPDVKGDLMKLASQNMISNQVRFMGFVQNVTERIKTASVYASTSNYEGISNSMLEALAMGIPCICTDCPVGGARMFIKNGINGYLIPVGDDMAFGAALEKAYGNSKLAESSKKEAYRLRSELSIDKITTQWLALFD